MSQLIPPQPASIPYASYDPQRSTDDSHLNLLAIFYFIWGGLIMLASCLALLYIIGGIVMLNSPSSSGGPSARDVGWIFIVLGSVFLLIGWTIGILNILSGLGIRKRKWRILTLIMAGVNCASVPLGTLLGVFTFIVLFRPTVTAQYTAAAA